MTGRGSVVVLLRPLWWWWWWWWWWSVLVGDRDRDGEEEEVEARSPSSSSSSPIGDAGAIIAFNLFVVECVDFPEEGPDDPLPNARVRIAKALFLFAFDSPRPIAAVKALLPPSNHHRFAAR